jgi:hypothetical protein
VLAPDSDLTALVGVNGAGKSNLLQAVLLLITQTARGRFGPPNRTGVIPCEVNRKSILYRARLFLSTESSRDEVLEADETWNFKALNGRNRWIVRITIQAFSCGRERERCGRTGPTAAMPSYAPLWLTRRRPRYQALRRRKPRRVWKYSMRYPSVSSSSGLSRPYLRVGLLGEHVMASNRALRSSSLSSLKASSASRVSAAVRARARPYPTSMLPTSLLPLTRKLRGCSPSQAVPVRK